MIFMLFVKISILVLQGFHLQFPILLDLSDAAEQNDPVRHNMDTTACRTGIEFRAVKLLHQRFTQ